jgi:SAM-dependent methyltransferase
MMPGNRPDDLESIEPSEAQLSGRELYGESLTPAQLLQWHVAEQAGYFELHGALADAPHKYAYEYAGLNHVHAIGTLLRMHFVCCLALGCADGSDVTPLAPAVDRFIAVEPAEKCWRTEIGGKPARFLKPRADGRIDVDSNAVDLVTSFGVLHHIPNVSHVVSETARVLRHGGIFVVREPISWMGDWRRPRPGLTANERGIPIEWFERTIAKNGFRIIRRRLCMLNPLCILMKRLGMSSPYSSRSVSVVDWILSEILRGNTHYRRDGWLQKIAPGSAFWLLVRR